MYPTHVNESRQLWVKFRLILMVITDDTDPQDSKDLCCLFVSGIVINSLQLNYMYFNS